RKFCGIVLRRETPPAVSPIDSVSLKDDANSRRTGTVSTLGAADGLCTAGGFAAGLPGAHALSNIIVMQSTMIRGPLAARSIPTPVGRFQQVTLLAEGLISPGRIA